MNRKTRREQRKREARQSRIKAKSSQEQLRIKQRRSLEEVRGTGLKIRPFLKLAGCDLPFYDYIDNYQDEFNCIRDSALNDRPSLHAVREVNASELNADSFEGEVPNNFKQVFFSIPDECEGYANSRDVQANLRGNATFFLENGETLRSVVLIERRPKTKIPTLDLPYALKVTSLLHEIGHVVDAEKGTNIRAFDNALDVVEAEAFAHTYALDHLAQRCLRQSYLMLYDAMGRLCRKSGYEGEIARLVLDRHEKVEIPNWNDFIEQATDIAMGT